MRGEGARRRGSTKQVGAQGKEARSPRSLWAPRRGWRERGRESRPRDAGAGSTQCPEDGVGGRRRGEYGVPSPFQGQRRLSRPPARGGAAPLRPGGLPAPAPPSLTHRCNTTRKASPEGTWPSRARYRRWSRGEGTPWRQPDRVEEEAEGRDVRRGRDRGKREEEERAEGESERGALAHPPPRAAAALRLRKPASRPARTLRVLSSSGP